MPQVIPPPVKKLTQKDKILVLMCRQPSKWFYPYEFMKPELGIMYVGYKAPTRIAELHKSYPFIFETRNKEQYRQRKLNVSEIAKWYDRLTPRHKEIVDQYLEVGALPL